MASVLFDITDVRDELPIKGLHSYHCFVKVASTITGLAGVVFTIKSVYLKASVSALWTLPISSQLLHTVNTCIALGILLSFTGIQGIACPTYDGLKLYRFLTVINFLLELAVSTSLFILKDKFQVNWILISNFCHTCEEPFTEIVNATSPATGIALTLALGQVLILYIISRFLKITEKKPQKIYNNDIQLSVRITTPGSALFRPCSSTPTDVTSHQLGLDLTLTSSPITGKNLQTPTLPNLRRKKSTASSHVPFYTVHKPAPARYNKFSRNFFPLPIPEIVITPATPSVPTPSSSSLHIAHTSLPDSSEALKQELP